MQVKEQIKKLIATGVNEYDAARQVINTKTTELKAKAESIKAKINA